MNAYRGWPARTTMTDAEVQELWDATDEDLREKDDDGVITLWERSADGTFRLGALTFRPIRDRDEPAA